jgi:hypothetical protein
MIATKALGIKPALSHPWDRSQNLGSSGHDSGDASATCPPTVPAPAMRTAVSWFTQTKGGLAWLRGRAWVLNVTPGTI